MPTKPPGTAHVELTDDGLIYCVLSGFLTDKVVRRSMRRTHQLVNFQRGQNQRPRLLLDVSAVTGQTSGARLQAKDLGSFGFERIGVCGASRTQRLVGQYIANAGGMGRYTRFFPTEAQARHWLHGRDSAEEVSDSGRLRLMLLAAAGAVALLTLLGWAVRLPLLTTFVPALPSVNPVTATVLLGLSTAIALGASPRRRHRSAAAGLAGLAAVVGGLVLIRYAGGFDSRIDAVLFSNRSGFSRMSLPAAVCICCTALLAVLLIMARWRRWQQAVFYGLLATVIGVAALSVVAYSFGYANAVLGLRPMSIPTAVILLLISGACSGLVRPAPSPLRLVRLAAQHRPAFLLLFILLIMLGVGWQQTNAGTVRSNQTAVHDAFTVTQNNINDRFSAYINVLHGFKAFFESSDYVSAADFESYYDRSQVIHNYPGFFAIGLIRVVPAKEITSFEASMNRGPIYSQASQLGKKYRVYPIIPNSPAYPVTYVLPLRSSLGFNYAYDRVRLTTIERARDSGQPLSSDVINLNASRVGAPVKNGFLLSMPVYKVPFGELEPTNVTERRQQIFGFINAGFQNDAFFKGVFSSTQPNSARFVLRNDRTNTVLYDSGERSWLPRTPTIEQTINVAGQVWRLSMYAPGNFGQSGSASLLPDLVLGGGLMLTLFAVALTVSLTRRRDQAMRLAKRITADLQHERDQAVASQQKDEAVLASIGDAVFAVDRKQRITVFNDAAEHISGYSRHEAIGQPFKDILHFISAKTELPYYGFIEQAFRGKVATMQDDTVLLRRDGVRLAVADSAAPIRNAKGRIEGAIVVFRDVSKEQALDQAKNEFVSVASHQLRTPLSAINWYAEMLLNGDVGKMSEGQTEYLHEIYDGNQRMIELVNALLDVSRLDLGKLANHPEAVDLPAMLVGLEREMHGSISAKKLRYNTDIASDVPSISADPKLIRMVMQNLLSNAVKYTPAGGQVTTTLRLATTTDLAVGRLHAAGRYVFLSVSDTGCGIPAAQQDKIFGKMFRADNVRALDVEGTGLGLYIVREVAEKLGGRVWFESREGRGTSFYVLLPSVTATEPAGR